MKEIIEEALVKFGLNGIISKKERKGRSNKNFFHT